MADKRKLKLVATLHLYGRSHRFHPTQYLNTIEKVRQATRVREALLEGASLW